MCLAALRGADGAWPASARKHGVAHVSYEELQAPTPEGQRSLLAALRSEGAVLLTGAPGYQDAVSQTLPQFSRCVSEVQRLRPQGEPGSPADPAHEAISSEAKDGLLRRQLPSGVDRLTLASSTTRGRSQQLPGWVSEECPEFSGRFALFRGVHEMLTWQFARFVDEAVAAGEPAHLPSGDVAAERSHSLEDLVRRGTRLEHLHRYTRPSPVPASSPPGSHGTSADGASAQPSAAAPALQEAAPTLRMHTDAGVLQALSVWWRAAPGAGGAPQEEAAASAAGILLQMPCGSVVRAEPRASGTAQDGGSGILFLVGQGLADWLPELGFRAAPHMLSLPGGLPRGFERVVFGTMLLPPDDWRISSSLSFGDWWRRAQQVVASGRRLQADVHSSTEDAEHPGCLSTGTLQRRLEDQALTCQAGTIWCWMQCSPAEHLPCGAELAICENAVTHELCDSSHKTHSPSCRASCPAAGEQRVLQVIGAGEDTLTSGVVDGIYKEDASHAGRPAYRKLVRGRKASAWVYWNEHYDQWWLYLDGYRNSSVLYVSDVGAATPFTSWHASHGASPPPVVARPFLEESAEVAQVEVEPKFCSGDITDMHMSGFVWSGGNQSLPCLVFLFPSWVLTDSSRFVGGLILTFLLGVLAEYCISVQRRFVSSSVSEPGVGWRKLRVRAILLAHYLGVRTVGYTVMLLAMTYSVQVFVAVLVGLTVGHGMFNMGGTTASNALTSCCVEPEEDSQSRWRENDMQSLMPFVRHHSGSTC